MTEFSLNKSPKALEMEEGLVKIIVPVYTRSLDEYEWVSLGQNIEVLGSYPIEIICPQSLDVGYITEKYPRLTVRRFDDAYFKGLAGYNRLMLSEEFYSAYADSRYVLICHTDAYIFRDELAQWCAKGYDYIGAPWIPRPMYGRFPFRQYLAVKRLFCRLTGATDRHVTDFKVGNGGLSLRRVDAHLRVLRELKDTAEQFRTRTGHHLYNEDVFFSLQVNRHGKYLRIPDYREALGFSFEKRPELCYRLNDNRLPFGCHAWYKPRIRKFWFPIVLGK